MADFIDMDQPVEDFIAHHGVKGQKWGVRKARPTSGRISKAKRSLITININKGSSAKKEKVAKKAGILKRAIESKKQSKTEYIHNLSDEDLNARINRLQRENQYRQLMQENVSNIPQPSKQSRGYADQFKQQLASALISGVTGGVGEFAKAAIKYQLSARTGIPTGKDKKKD